MGYGILAAAYVNSRIIFSGIDGPNVCLPISNQVPSHWINVSLKLNDIRDTGVGGQEANVLTTFLVTLLSILFRK